jgi:hypothetical protein
MPAHSRSSFLPPSWAAALQRAAAPVFALARPLSFIGALPLAFGALVAGRQRSNRRDLGRVAAAASANALPIVVVVNALVGAILAFVGAVQLVKFGAGIFVADLVGIAVAREMASVITAVVMAGRTGAAFAAELATMQTGEEIDALCCRASLRCCCWRRCCTSTPASPGWPAGSSLQPACWGCRPRRIWTARSRSWTWRTWAWA